MRYSTSIKINSRQISLNNSTYFIADIAANHDGDLSRAKDLIWLAKEAGAAAAKFQHFRAGKIVSDYGFRHLSGMLGHQSSWKKSVFETYQRYECNRNWNKALVDTARAADIDFMTTPYDEEAVEMLDQYLPAYKIGSGDITWPDFIGLIARKGKPVLLATGAATIEDVTRAVDAVLAHNEQIVLLQCNTNYTARLENLRHVNLRVITTYASLFPGMLLGLSDHTQGHSTVLGAITLGARVIEKHFTDDNSREGPDHPFSMNPEGFREMVERSRELELALGDGIKRVEENEKETVVIQQRCLRFTRDINAGEDLASGDLEAIRPAPEGAVKPYFLGQVLGKRMKRSRVAGDALFFEDIVE